MAGVPAVPLWEQAALGNGGPQYVPNENPFTNGSTVATPPIQPDYGTSIGADAAETAAEAAATKGPNMIGRLLVKAGVPEEYIGPTYGPGVAIGIGSQFLSKPIGNLYQQLTGGDGNAIANFVSSAGAGAGLGSVVGPEGALVGAIGGGLKSLLTKQPNFIKNAQNAMDLYQIDPSIQAQMKSTYNDMYDQNPTQAKQWLASVIQEAGNQWMSQNDPVANAQNNQQIPANLYLQQLAGQAMAPYVSDMRNNLTAAGNALNAGLKGLSPEMQAQVKPLISQYVNMSKNVGDAYALQAQAFPIENQIAKTAWTNLVNKTGSSSLATSLLSGTAGAPTGTVPQFAVNLNAQ